MTPFHKNINLTRFLFREKFVWRGKVLLLANSHKFWYPTLGAIQDLVLQAGATKNPLHQFQTWSHFVFSKISNSSILKNIEFKYSYIYQTQKLSKISKSNIPINIKLKDSEIYQTPKLSDFLQKFACSNLLKLSQISCNFLEFKYSQNSPPQTMLSSAVIFSRWSWVMSRDHWSLLVSQQESQGSISPTTPSSVYNPKTCHQFRY